MISALKQRTDELAIQIRLTLEVGGKDTSKSGFSPNNAGNGVDLEAKPLMKRGEDGEYEDTRNLNNR